MPQAYLDAGLTSALGGAALGSRPDHRRPGGALARAPRLRRRRGALSRVARQPSRQQPAARAVGGGPEPCAAARKRRPADRRHRPRLQQPAHRHPGQPAGARGAARARRRRARRSSSSAPRRAPRGAAPSSPTSCSRSRGARCCSRARSTSARMLHSLADMLRRTLDQRIAIDVESVAARARSVLADPGQLEAALLNIAINARDAMPNGGTLRFRAEPFAGLPAGIGGGSADAFDRSGLGFVAISIADSGVGMTRGGEGARVRAVLHHQGAGPRHRPRPEHGVRLRQAVAGALRVDSEPGARHDRDALSSGPGSIRRGRRPSPVAGRRPFLPDSTCCWSRTMPRSVPSSAGSSTASGAASPRRPAASRRCSSCAGETFDAAPHRHRPRRRDARHRARGAGRRALAARPRSC